MPRSPRWARKFFDDVVLSYDGDECLVWPYATVKGYGALRIDGKLEYVCRLAIKKPQPSPDHLVAHSCGHGQFGCVAEKHLIWKTQKGNKADELLHGTRNFGRRNGKVILTESKVLWAVSMRHKKTYEEIADDLGVSKGAIRDIMVGRNWGWLTGLSTERKEHATQISE